MLGLGSSLSKPVSLPITTPAPDGWQEFVDATKSIFARFGRATQDVFANTNPADGTRSVHNSVIPFNATACWVQDGQVVLNEHNYYVQMLVSSGAIAPDQTWDVQDFIDDAYANVDTSTEIGAAWFDETYLDSSYPAFSTDQLESFGVHVGQLLFALGYTYQGNYDYYLNYLGITFDLSTQISSAVANPDFVGQFDWIENIPATVTSSGGITIYANTPYYSTSDGKFSVYNQTIGTFVSNNLPFFEPEIAYQYGLSFNVYNVSFPGGVYYNNWGCNNPIINSLASTWTSAFWGNPDTVFGEPASIMESYLDGDTYWKNSSWWNSIVAWANENPHIVGLYDPSAGETVNILDVFYSDEADNYGFDGFAPPQ